jgi:hypothetical protein
MDLEESLRSIPSVGLMLDDPAFADALSLWGRALVTDLLREELERLRARLIAGKTDGSLPGRTDLAATVGAQA